jgi:hypothetical protein
VRGGGVFWATERGLLDAVEAPDANVQVAWGLEESQARCKELDSGEILHGGSTRPPARSGCQCWDMAFEYLEEVVRLVFLLFQMQNESGTIPEPQEFP